MISVAGSAPIDGGESGMHRTVYQQADVDGLSVFYREAGPPDKPIILLLHGFPSSSRQWEPLLTRLADEFHLVAPDYPGFGHSDAPDPAGFAYTFDHLAEITGRFGRDRYVLFVRDYGSPVGFRLATAHPERVQAIIVQNAVAHEDGLGPLRETRRAFWADRTAHEAALRENFFSPAATRLRHVGTSLVPADLRPGPVDRRARLPRTASRPISRTICSMTTAPRGELSGLAAMAAGAPAAAAGALGPLPGCPLVCQPSGRW